MYRWIAKLGPATTVRQQHHVLQCWIWYVWYLVDLYMLGAHLCAWDSGGLENEGDLRMRP